MKASTFSTWYCVDIDYRKMECVRGLLPMEGHLSIDKTYSRILLTIMNTYWKCKIYRGRLYHVQKIVCRKLPTTKAKSFDCNQQYIEGGGSTETTLLTRARLYILYITHQLGISDTSIFRRRFVSFCVVLENLLSGWFFIRGQKRSLSMLES